MLSSTRKATRARILSSPLIISKARHTKRRYATPSAPSNASAALAQRSHATVEDSSDLPLNEMSILARKKPIVLPSPLPPRTSLPPSTSHLIHYPSSSTLSTLSIMEACLTNFLDMPRAFRLLEEARHDERIRRVMGISVWNAFIRTFWEYADHLEREGGKGKIWRDRAWTIWQEMKEEGIGNVMSYAIVLRTIAK